MVNVIAEIGINHNGDIDTCLEMIQAAKDSGADYVKFQKRDPDVCVPELQIISATSFEVSWLASLTCSSIPMPIFQLDGILLVPNILSCEK